MTSSPEQAAREAARYRRRLRETEAERDALQEQVHALRRAIVELVDALGVTVPTDPLSVFTDQVSGR